MTRGLQILAVFLVAATVHAQSAAPVLVQPTITARLVWDYAPSATEISLQALHHFEVQWTPTGLWTSSQKLLTIALPNLMPGSYVATVRACATVAVTSCTLSAPLAFTVIAAPLPTAAAASALRLGAGGVPLPPPPPPPGGALLSSGWENGALGCGPQLLDGLWADYGGSTACDGAVHDADVVGDVTHGGGHALRVIQKPGGVNGTDFRILSRSFGAQPELTLTFWVRYDTNYRWANADAKIVLLMGGSSPNIYINYRGGADATHPRLCFYPLANDTFFCQTTGPYVTVNAWFRIRIHVVTGASGKVELFLQPDGQAETPLVLTRDAGTGATSPSSVNTGTIDAIKLDTTYNSGGSVTENMAQWYDGISVYQGLAP